MDRLLPWLRRSGWAYIAAAVALALVAVRVAGGDGGGGQPSATSPTAPAALAAPAGDGPAAAEVPLLVHVAGEVRDPGVYELAPGARVIEAVREAGGPTRRADTSALNLAAPVQDGQQVRVPPRAAAGAAGDGPAPASAAPGAPISLSSATTDQLEALDGIGPAIAGRIVAWRDSNGGFGSVDQLLEVPGIGPARLEALRPHVVP
ncbi:MAG: helix-hairpin-helix domain-containing protein [Thermoleophilia bacterium]